MKKIITIAITGSILGAGGWLYYDYQHAPIPMVPPAAVETQPVVAAPDEQIAALPTPEIMNQGGALDPSVLYLAMQPYVVSISSRIADAAYSNPGTLFGTGSVLNKEKGIILTNAHVITPDGILDHYDITLHNGTTCEAKLVYYDPWHDFALLQTDPENLINVPQSLPVARHSVHLGDAILIIGKNENNHFSMQTGTVANLFQITAALPCQSFRISLNAQGGASGSPIINARGQTIGLLYASNNVTSAFALPIDYALDAMDQLLKNQHPKRYSTGALLKMVSIDDLVKHDHFPKDLAAAYVEKFKDAFNQGMIVHGVLPHGDQQLKPGDFIYKVNGQEVGPSLYHMDKIINENGAQKVTMTVIRHGKPLTLSLNTYNLHNHCVTRILSFGKAMFYEIDDAIMSRTGAKRGVFVSNLKPGGSFFDVLPGLNSKSGYKTGLISLVSIEGQPIHSLDDLMKYLPTVMKKKYFYMTIRNYAADLMYNDELSFNQAEQIKYVSYYHSDGLPELYTFKDYTWHVDVLNVS